MINPSAGYPHPVEVASVELPSHLISFPWHRLSVSIALDLWDFSATQDWSRIWHTNVISAAKARNSETTSRTRTTLPVVAGTSTFSRSRRSSTVVASVSASAPAASRPEKSLRVNPSLKILLNELPQPHFFAGWGLFLLVSILLTCNSKRSAFALFLFSSLFLKSERSAVDAVP